MRPCDGDAADDHARVVRCAFATAPSAGRSRRFDGPSLSFASCCGSTPPNCTPLSDPSASPLLFVLLLSSSSSSSAEESSPSLFRGDDCVATLGGRIGRAPRRDQRRCRAHGPTHRRRQKKKRRRRRGEEVAPPALRWAGLAATASRARARAVWRQPTQPPGRRPARPRSCGVEVDMRGRRALRC